MSRRAALKTLAVSTAAAVGGTGLYGYLYGRHELELTRAGLPMAGLPEPLAGLRIGLITDGRFSGATRGLMVGHVAPEAALGGPIAAIREGDKITIDTKIRRLELEISDAEITRRMAEWKPPAPRYKTGVFAKYAALVRSAAEGAITTPVHQSHSRL